MPSVRLSPSTRKRLSLPIRRREGSWSWRGPAATPRSWDIHHRLLDAQQLHYAARYVPVLDVQVAVLVPGRAVRAAEDSLDPLLLRHIVIRPLRGVRVVAED